MFSGCNKLKNLDISHFDTPKLEKAKLMFFGCRSLRGLNLSNFKTKKVSNMKSMFSNCKLLDEFNVCWLLKRIHLSNSKNI